MENSSDEEDSSVVCMVDEPRLSGLESAPTASTSAMLPTTGLVVPSGVENRSGDAESVHPLPANEARLHQAIQSGDHHDVKSLLTSVPNLPISQETFTNICRMNKTDLIILMTEKMQESTIIEHFSRALDNDEHTILHLGVIHCWMNVITFIMNLRINDLIRTKNGRNYNILHLASLYNNVEALVLILKFLTPEVKKAMIGEVCDIEGLNALHVAAKEGSDSIIQVLMKYIPVDSQTLENGNTPLYYSLLSNSISTIMLLLDNGATLDSTNLGEITEKVLTNIVNCDELVQKLLFVFNDCVQYKNEINSDGELTKFSIRNPYCHITWVLKSFVLLLERNVHQLVQHPLIQTLILINLHIHRYEYAIVPFVANQTLVDDVRDMLSINFESYSPNLSNVFHFTVSTGQSLELADPPFILPDHLLNGLRNLCKPPLGSKRVTLPNYNE